MTYLKRNQRVVAVGVAHDPGSFHGRHGVIRGITGSGVSVVLDHDDGPTMFARHELAPSGAELELGPSHRARFRDPFPRDERRIQIGAVPKAGMEVAIEEWHDSGAWICRFRSIRQALDTGLYTNPVPGGVPSVRAVEARWLDPLPLWEGGPVPVNPDAPAWWYARARGGAVAAVAALAGPVAGIVTLTVTYPDGEERRSALAATELPAVEAALRRVPGVTYRIEAA